MGLLRAYIKFDKVVDWAHKEFQDSATNFMRDMKSMQALWNWIYLALYVFLCVYVTIKGIVPAIKVAIATTGGLVGTIFTVYVWSKNQKNGKKKQK